jgi:protein gp37
MNKTSIEWTHRPQTRGPAGGFTWNPIRARRKDGKTGTFCTRISPGCTHCYASTINKRFGTGAEYTVPNLADHEFFVDDKIMAQPMQRKKPATIFVGDMFDLFHEAIPLEMIAQVFWVMEHAKQHTFQVLTKRAERMQKFVATSSLLTADFRAPKPSNCERPRTWPLPHVWLGVSVEDQKRADERIPYLALTPAAVRFLSVEPMLEEIFIEPELMGQTSWGRPTWVICGGESGPGARPFNLSWATALRDQCAKADVPFFMKQLGSHARRWMPDGETLRFETRDRKGGDMGEWPDFLKVREFPA